MKVKLSRPVKWDYRFYRATALLSLLFPSLAQPRTKLSLSLSSILENETKVGCHKGAQNGAVKRTLFDASSDESGERSGLATRPFVYKLIDITKFKCAA